MSFSAHADGALAAILSISGTSVTSDEAALFKKAKPLGFILFARNCDTPEQIKNLTAQLHELMGRECPVLIDQEGGRVQRLKPPRWREHPPMRQFGEMAENDMDHALGDLRFTILQLAEELADVGVNVNCAPVLDLLIDGAHDCIGDRAFSENVNVVSRLGATICRSFLANGITPVMKHIPGHGRACSDSHFGLPRVDTLREELQQNDFVPFERLASGEFGKAIWGMMGHVVYTALDEQFPASVSSSIIEEVVRGEIGFDGFLISDDLNMKALESFGSVEERCQKTIDAGCDAALYCAGKLPEMEKIAESVPKLSEKALERLQKAAEFTKLAA